MLDQATVYATYEDDGRDGPGAQDSSTFPDKVLLIFGNMILAHEYDMALRAKQYTGRKNPRITAFYSQDKEDIFLGGCCLARVVEPLTCGPERAGG